MIPLFTPPWIAVALTLLAGAADTGRVPRGCQHALLTFADDGLPRALPSGWAVRAVRGFREPLSEVVDSGGLRFLRLSGTGRAAFFVRRLETPLRSTSGRLGWTWRVPVTPVGASAASPATDDASLRVFVVFERHATFARAPRALFYTLGDGDPAQRTAGRGAVQSINAGRPLAARHWVDVLVDPVRDYERIWRAAAPAIVAVGVMQDTDQTGSAAVGDMRRLEWTDDATQCR
ncbi:MAG: DUF3047 domain-containing protein [Gemmatimonadaceae bacterium]|nr:DUF3047 domain-containing protein [Gemmatimonadaceae bacterium]